MATKFPLNLSKDYVSSWTEQDAYREITQNGIDQETEMPGNKLTIEYFYEEKKLTIANKRSVLQTSSLLLGKTSKANNNKLIGQFGEGYKIALLVLTRLNKRVTIYNYGNREVWTARFVKARSMDNEEVLTVFVDKQFPWTKVPNNDLTFEIEGVTEEEYIQFVDRTLRFQPHFNEKVDYLQTSFGRILLSESCYSGKLFVNGLYVSDTKLKYGYDVKPQYLDIGRDRNLVNSFDLQCLTSKMWSETNDDRITQLLLNKCSDVEYLHKDWNRANLEVDPDEAIKPIAEKTYEAVSVAYEKDDEPIIYVSSQAEIDEVRQTYEHAQPVIVSEQVKTLVNKSKSYQDKKAGFKQRSVSLQQQYTIWKSKHRYQLDGVAFNELDNIVTQLLKRGGELNEQGNS
jgi:hypothetical protein